MHNKDLSAAFQLAHDCQPRQLVIPATDLRDHRQALFRRRLNHADIANAAQAQVERPRDGSRRQCEDVDARAQFLEVLFVLHAKALFFVDDHQAQLLEANVLREQAMRADDDIDLATGQPFRNLRLLRLGAEAREHLDGDRKSRQARFEVVKMLLRQHRRWRQDRHLRAILHRFESRAQGDLGLAKTDIAADKAIHRLATLHIGFDFLNDPQLIFRFDEGETGFHLVLPGAIRAEDEARRSGALAVDLQQFPGFFFGVAPRLSRALIH